MDGNGVGCCIGRNGIRVEEGYAFYHRYYRVRNASDEKSTPRGFQRIKDGFGVRMHHM